MAYPASRVDERVNEVLSFASHKQWCPADRREGWSAAHRECGCGLERARQSLLAVLAPATPTDDSLAPLWEALAAELPQRAEECRHLRLALREARAALAGARSLLGDLARIEMAWGVDRPSHLASEAHDREMRLAIEVQTLEGELDEAAEAWERAREARRLQLLARRVNRFIGYHEERTPALLALRSQLASALFLVEEGTPLQVRVAREAGLAVERALSLLE